MPTADELSDLDVVIVSASAMATHDTPWFLKVEWTTIIADEGHRFLRGQHNSNKLSETLRWWRQLQHRTKSCFVLSGTPFVTKVSFDAVKMIEAVATEEVRSKWGKEYTAKELTRLFAKWKTNPAASTDQEKAERAAKASEYAMVLAGCTLRRDKNSLIRGQRVIQDYIGQCITHDKPLVSNLAELAAREEAYRSMRLTQASAVDRHGILRCLAYTLRFKEWWHIDRTTEGKAQRKRQFWDSWTAGSLGEEAKKHVRLNKLVKLFLEGSQTGNGVVCFAQRVFLAELAIKVRIH